jgi:NDP-sugar pyrophosphorylase family protein
MIVVPAGDTIEVGDRMNLAGDIVIDSGVSLRGPLVIQRDSRIASSAIVGPYVSMGPSSSIGEECTISNSLLLGSTEVPANRTLEGVIVHANGIERG